MTSPLYSVGQSVAVWAPRGRTLPLITKIEECSGFLSLGQTIFARGRGECRATIAGHHYTITGGWCHEKFISPINPDTEYLTDSAPQKLETPTQEEVGTTGSEPGREWAQRWRKDLKSTAGNP